MAEIALNSNPVKSQIVIGANRKLTLSDAKLLARNASLVALNPEAYSAIHQSHDYLKLCIDQRLPVYGTNTNFGDQVNFIDERLKDQNADLYYDSIHTRQESIIKSLACGLGNPVSTEVVRVAMMLRAHCLAQGYSGVTPTAIEAILAYLNAGITPVVRCYGSIGASGDLIPLAMIAAGLIGEDVDVHYQGQIIKAPQAMNITGLTKFKPSLRDGLAMINGTSFMTAIASISLYNLKRLFDQMLCAIAMSLESMLVISSSYHPLVHQLKLQTGEMTVNQFLLNFWEGSLLLSDLDEVRSNNVTHISSIPKNIKPVQDYYSLRSVAQGFGPFQENLEKTTVWIENEMNSVNDNPIIDAEGNKIHHSANFMGYFVTDACDLLKMNIAQASTWIHALLANMVHPRKNHDLPANLVPNPGKNNGFRSLQLLAAALAVQNRKFAVSHQSFTLPTEGDNQDVNSLGTHAALDLQEAVANLERLTAILLLASSQALELRDIKKASPRAQKIYQLIREHSPSLLNCRPMSEEISRITTLLDEEQI